MRETRLSGSEGGGPQLNAASLPLSFLASVIDSPVLDSRHPPLKGGNISLPTCSKGVNSLRPTDSSGAVWATTKCCNSHWLSLRLTTFAALSASE